VSQDIVLLNKQDIRSKIFTIRGVQVMLDRDLASIYGVETKIFNQAVKRNGNRFPERFRFQLTEEEYQILRSQFVTSRSEHGGSRYLPYAFTEQGVAMLSSVLKNKTAVEVSIRLIDSFIEMRRFIQNYALLFQRLDKVELQQFQYKLETDEKFEYILKALEEGKELPKQGIFFDGQFFDAYSFISDLIRSARKSIILIDNYIDDSVLTILEKRVKGVNVTIYTKTISKQLKLDLAKYNAQYPAITVKELKDSHDRFLILDETEVYHIGASLKDLGKKWFAFSKFSKEAFGLVKKLEENRE
jgi:hypothetical protein